MDSFVDEFDDWELQAAEVRWLVPACARGCPNGLLSNIGWPTAFRGPAQGPVSARRGPRAVQRQPPPWATTDSAPSSLLQDKGKRPMQHDPCSSDEESDGEEYDDEHVEQQEQPAECGPTEDAAASGAQPGLAAEDSEPGDLTCAICLGNIPLENLALVKVCCWCRARGQGGVGWSIPGSSHQQTRRGELSNAGRQAGVRGCGPPVSLCTAACAISTCSAMCRSCTGLPCMELFQRRHLTLSHVLHVNHTAGLRPHVLRHVYPALGPAQGGALVPPVQAALHLPAHLPHTRRRAAGAG